MMRHSETMRAASRLLLSHPIVCLLAALAAVVVVGVLGPIKVVHADDVALKIQGESFATQPAGTTRVSGAGYDGGAALKFNQNVTASTTVNCSAVCDVTLWAQGGQSGGQASLSVNGSPPQALTTSTVQPYTFVDANLPAGPPGAELRVTASGTGTGHNAILDYVTFPRSSSGTPPPTTQCSDNQDNDGDGAVDLIDPGCTEASDNDETNALPPAAACDDDQDNDGDGLTDFPIDPGCTGATDNDETNATDPASRTVPIPCGQDIDARVNEDPPGTSTRFELGNCINNPYIASATVVPRDGDKLVGPGGTYTQRDTAFDPSTTTIIRGSSSLAQVMKPEGTVHLEWITVEGGDFTGQAGTGVGIAGGTMSSNSTMTAVTVRDNEGAGISNMHGTFHRIELTNNTTNPSALGFIGSGGKAISEVVVTQSYVHETQGNGLWCDEFCLDSSLGSFTVRDSVVVNNGRAGIRWERIGTATGEGEATIANNEVHGNGFGASRGGVDARDAANAIIENNRFGRVTIVDSSGSSITYPPNDNNIAVRATDSGRSDRPNLANITIRNNILNGETITGCGLPDTIVACAGNSP